MRSRREGLALIVGALGLAFAISNLLPPLAESLVVGASLGIIIAGPVGELSLTPAPRLQVQRPPEVRLKEAVRERRAISKIEFEKTLDRFDSLISRVHVGPGDDLRSDASMNFKTSVDALTRHYPVWDSEGRIRTYVLMKEISESMDSRNADAYLDMAYHTLVARGEEATQLSRITLNGKVEKIYREPKSENTHLAGTLLLMNRGDELYAEGMTVDAIHLWSETRFAKLLRDFAAVPMLGPRSKESILDLLEKEAAKAKRAGDRAVYQRAERLRAVVLSASKVPAH